jgi:hypothetical protein
MKPQQKVSGHHTLLCLVIISAWFIGTAFAQNPNLPMVLSFSQSSIGANTWAGRVSGAIQGKLKTIMVCVDKTNPVWRVTIDWVVEAAEPSQSFVARLTGTLDSHTGVTDMTGVITEGYLAGTTLHEMGRPVYPGHTTTLGTLRIVQASGE